MPFPAQSAVVALRDDRINTVPVKVVAVKVDALALKVSSIRAGLGQLTLDPSQWPDVDTLRAVVSATRELDQILDAIAAFKAQSSFV